jgi:hypothetical protein
MNEEWDALDTAGWEFLVSQARVAALVTRLAENQDADRDLPLGEC